MSKKDLTNKKMNDRSASAVRISDGEAIVEAFVTCVTLCRDGDNKAHAEETRVSDILAILKSPPTVSQSSEDVAAIQGTLPEVGKAALERVGISIIRSILGV